ncbi:C2H2-type zinc finger protein [Phanerochaete sordida]|uniref:C2H2-type zinc finger protein n=1 Tax=Phanerochaete sordida TaxID=48140 RepID=A0A9P3G6D3_9APHY|nr:C2H2-type zinc finger protein [Phanerochaete sordida]
MSTVSLPSIREVFPDFFDGVGAPTDGRSISTDSSKNSYDDESPCIPAPPPSAAPRIPLDLSTRRTPNMPSAHPPPYPQLSLRYGSYAELPPLQHAPADPECPAKKRYVCDVCEKRFERPSSLTTHMNSHTGNRPHVCPHPACPKAFTTRSNMLRHSRSHDGPGELVLWDGSPAYPDAHPPHYPCPR